MVRIVRHNNESVREGYMRNGGKQVKLFKSALKAFQCNNRIVMAQRKHLDDFLSGRIIGRLQCGRTQLEVSEELGIAKRVSFPGFGNDFKIMIITDLHVQSVMMTGHIYRDVILEQHVRLFLGTLGAEILFMDDNTRPHCANIVDAYLQSEDITRMDWPAYSPDLNPKEHVGDMLGRRIAARQPPPTRVPELRRALVDDWCIFPKIRFII
ncbi:uncharacterized protein TNCV_2729781 [Trichonephila clavipes]|nr:uncharacterized protein TNCV_2729781 [Trichonephila clavipes]